MKRFLIILTALFLASPSVCGAVEYTPDARGASSDLGPSGYDSNKASTDYRVNATNGNMFYMYRDLFIPAPPGRGFPLRIVRTYNSKDNDLGPFGRGWSFNYNIKLEEEEGYFFIVNGSEVFMDPGDYEDIISEFETSHADTDEVVGELDESYGYAVEDADTAEGIWDDALEAAEEAEMEVDALKETRDELDGERNDRFSELEDIETDMDVEGEEYCAVGGNYVTEDDVNNCASNAATSECVEWWEEYDLWQDCYDYCYEECAYELIDDCIGDEYADYIDGLENQWDDVDEMISELEEAIEEIDEAIDEYDLDELWGIVEEAEDDFIRAGDIRDEIEEDWVEAQEALEDIEQEWGDFVSDTPDPTQVITLSDENGSKTAVAENDNLTIPTWYPYRFDLANRTATHKHGTFYQFHPDGRVDYIEDRNGNKLTFEYNSQTQELIRVTDSVGRSLDFQWQYGHIVAVTDPVGRTTYYNYSGNLLTSVTNPDGETVTYNYSSPEIYRVMPSMFTVDTDGNPNFPIGAEIYRSENPELPAYFVMVNGVRTTVGMATSRPFLSQVIDQRGNSTYFEYGPDGSCTLTSEEDGVLEREYTYHKSWRDNERKTVISDSRGHLTEKYWKSYDFGLFPGGLAETELVYKIVELMDGQSSQTTIYEWTAHNVTKITDSNGKEWNKTYDLRGNLISEADPLGKTTTYYYEPSYYFIASKVDANGHRWDYEYDAEGNLRYEWDPTPEQNLTEHAYNEYGQRKETIDARGHKTQYKYEDPHGYLSEVKKDAAKGTAKTQYFYDILGNKLREVDGNNHWTTYEYDLLNRLIRTERQGDPDNFVSRAVYDEIGNLIKKIDPREVVTTYEYDEIDRLIKVTEAAGLPEQKITRYGYDTENNKLWETDANGHTTGYTHYDELNRLREEEDHFGRIIGYCYDGAGDNSSQSGSTEYGRKKDKYTRIINRRGHTTTYEYDGAYRLKKTTDPLGNETSYVYDSVGNKRFETDGNGWTTEYRYDERNLLLKVIDPYGDYFEYEYDEVGNKVKEWDKLRHLTQYEYTPRNLLEKVIDPDGKFIYYEYDGVGNKDLEDDKKGNRTKYKYNTRNLLTETIAPYSTHTYFNYDDSGNKTEEIDPNGIVTGYTFDGQNRMTGKTRDPGGLNLSTNYQYDPVGNRTAITDGNGHTTRYDYDELNRLQFVRDPEGGVTEYRYDKNGNKTLTIDAEGRYSAYYDYDAADRLILKGDAREYEYSYTYDGVGNRKTQTDAAQNVITYNYDKLNRLENRISGGVTISYSYDDQGNRLSMTDQGGVTQYQYDNLNRLWKVIHPDGKTLIYEYDENSNRTAMKYYATPPPNPAPSPDELTEYDYDDLNRLATLTDPEEGETTYVYDNGSRLEWMNYPNGASANYGYDNGDRIISLTHDLPGSPDQSFTYTYDKVGNRLTMHDSTGLTSYTYDKLYRLTHVAYPDNSSVTYTYDKVGNRLSEKKSDGTTIYSTYNELNQLTARGQVNPGDTPLNTNILGDASDLNHLGNPTTVASITVNDATVVDIIPPPTNRFRAYNLTLQPGPNTITATAKDQAGNTTTTTATVIRISGEPTTYEYDMNGCLTKKTVPGGGETTYYYDFENRLTTINLPTSQLINFSYDGDKRRTSKTVDFTSQTTTTKFLYDGINILKDLDGNGAVKASYVQGIGIDKLIYVSEWVSQTDQNISYYHSDALGSVRSMTDTSGVTTAAYVYDAWGNITESTGESTNEYKFTGRRFEEEIGLQYNRARFYDPEIGRFTTPDPLTGGPDDPTISYFNGIYSIFHRFIKEHVDSLQPDKQNRYVYCYNNPINLIDPLGLDATLNPLEQKADEVSTAEQQGQLKPQDSTKTDDKTNENPGKTATDVEQNENVSTDTAIQTEEIGEQNGGGSVSEEGGGVWGFIKDLGKFVLEGLKDEACRTFEGSRWGGGVGAEAKVKVGPLGAAAKLHSIEGTRVTQEGLERFSEEKAEASLKILAWNPTISFEDQKVNLDLLKFEKGGLTVKNFTTVEIGGTIPHITGAAINLELSINLFELVNPELPR